MKRLTLALVILCVLFLPATALAQPSTNAARQRPTVVLNTNAGRTPLVYYAVGAATGATGTETALTLTKASGTSATATGTSFTVPVGKKFRITAIVVGAQGNAVATAQATIFSVRINTAGAVTTASTPVVLQARVATPATASAYDRVLLPIDDGYEITGSATIQFGVTANSVYVTNAPTLDVTIIGFLY